MRVEFDWRKMFTPEEVAKSPWWWIRNRKEISNALEVIATALEEYDEGCGLAGSDIPNEFEDIQNFFEDVCYPDWK